MIMALQGGLGIPNKVYLPPSPPPTNSVTTIASIAASALLVAHRPAGGSDGGSSDDGGGSVSGVSGVSGDSIVKGCAPFVPMDTSIGSEYVRYWCLGVGGASVLMGVVICILGCPCFALPGPRSLETDLSLESDQIAFGDGAGGGGDTERQNLLSRSITGYQTGTAGVSVALPSTRSSGGGLSSTSRGGGLFGSGKRAPAGVGTPSGVSGAEDVVDPTDDIAGAGGGTQLMGFPRSPQPGAGASAVIGVSPDDPVTPPLNLSSGAAIGSGPTALAPLLRQPSSGSRSGRGSPDTAGTGGGSQYGTPLAHAPQPKRTPGALPGSGVGTPAASTVSGAGGRVASVSFGSAAKSGSAAAATAATPAAAAKAKAAGGKTGLPLPEHLKEDVEPVDNPFAQPNDMI